MFRLWFLLMCSLMIKQASGALCKPQKQSFTVSDAAQAAKLVDAALCEGGKINVRWLNKVVMQDTIKLGNNTVLTIQGSADSSIIDGNEELRLFNVSSSSTLVLQDMTVQNGFATVAGGAILVFNNATLQLRLSSNCSRRIYLVHAMAQAHHTHMCNCRHAAVYTCHAHAVDACGSTGGVGGSIYGDTSSTVQVYNTTFSGCTASNTGAAVFSKGALSVEASTFENNTAVSHSDACCSLLHCHATAVDLLGGAIWGLDVDVQGTSFTGNSAGSDGGAVFVPPGGLLTVAGSTFEANTGEQQLIED
eukprot:7203-Heterococcus_DN1.PRE.2